MSTGSGSRTTCRKPSAVQVDLPRVVEVGDHLEGFCVRWFRRGHGFGFIEVRGCPDFFVSARDVLNAPDLRRGDHVAFDVRMDGQGRMQAVNVVLVDGEPIAMPPVRAEALETAPWE